MGEEREDGRGGYEKCRRDRDEGMRLDGGRRYGPRGVHLAGRRFLDLRMGIVDYGF